MQGIHPLKISFYTLLNLCGKIGRLVFVKAMALAWVGLPSPSVYDVLAFIGYREYLLILPRHESGKFPYSSSITTAEGYFTCAIRGTRIMCICYDVIGNTY